MPRITRVYTKTGDDGSTGLGGGQRVAKESLRIEAFGTVDELNSAIGFALTLGAHPDLVPTLLRIQNELFHLGADLCVLEEDKKSLPVPTIRDEHVRALEIWMDRLTESLDPLENFILPGGSQAAAALHVARCVCRRAERRVAALARVEPIGRNAIPYLNRLSDALFVMARYENKRRGVEDPLWNSRT